ncbi:MAG TPA: LpxD N-terminal domain-containing protein, partial [Mucilaginibacter sp.]
MQFTAQDISLLLSGTVEGDGSVTVDKLSKIEDGTAGSLSFLANPKYEHFLYTTKASAVIVNNDLQLTGPVSATLIRVENAYSAFTV